MKKLGIFCSVALVLFVSAGAFFVVRGASCTDFCDISESIGLTSQIRYGHSAAFADINGDGWDDLWVADSDLRFRKPYGISYIFINHEGKRFEQIDPRELGIRDEHLFINWSASFVDFDNDGDPDLMLSSGAWEPAALGFYRNDISDSGSFTDITEEAGFSTAKEEWWGSSWSDFDNDGYLDVVVAVRVGGVRLYHNNRDGTFSEVSGSMGIDAMLEDGRNAVWLDYDLDGDQDLFVGGFSEHDVHLYRNDGNRFTLQNSALVLQTEIFDEAPLGHVFVTVMEDFNLDGYPDLYLGRDHHQDLLFINQKDGTFHGYGKEVGLDMVLGEFNGENSMAIATGDIDDSGYPDILIGTGHIHSYTDILLCLHKDDTNEAGVKFVRCSEPVVEGHGEAATHGIVLSDFDLDGDADIVYNLTGSSWYDARNWRDSQVGPTDSRGRTVLYERKKDPEVNTAVVKLEGTTSSRDAVGARIHVRGERDQYYWVKSSEGFVSQAGRWIVVRLGDALSADMTIEWPSGKVTTATVKSGEKAVIVEE